MKTRNGFVSNSSSSSFICDVCSGVESGWDACLSEMEMFDCENGHTVHESCAVNFEAPDEDVLGDDYDEEWRYSHDTSQCPICSLSNIPDGIKARYLLARAQQNSKGLGKELRERFANYEALMAWIAENEVS
jgi:hypothetical protein